MRLLGQILEHVLLLLLTSPKLRRIIRIYKPSLTIMRRFLLVQKCKLFGVKMGSGTMQQLRLIHRMGIMFVMMAGEMEKRKIEETPMNALLAAERVAEATKQAIKRKIAQAASVDFHSRSLPPKLRIDPNDPEDVKAFKRKKIHAFKSKVRLEQLEVAQNKRQNAGNSSRHQKARPKR